MEESSHHHLVSLPFVIVSLVQAWREPCAFDGVTFPRGCGKKTITMYLAPIFLTLSILLVGDSKLAACFVFVYALLLLLTRRG